MSRKTRQTTKYLKSATVALLHKSDSLVDVNNHRPFSVLPALIKIFERHVHQQLHDHLVANKLLWNHQSAFWRGHSTCSAFLDVSDFILKNIGKRNVIGGIFLDLSKVFDMPSHPVLKCKMEKIGIRGNALSWFDNYLNNRTQSVCSNGTLSYSLGHNLRRSTRISTRSVIVYNIYK